MVCVALALLALAGAGCGSGGSDGNTDAAQEEEEAVASECDPNYAGACLDPNAVDYDCAGGSGDGPEYTGQVTVVGVDHYGLDSDGDGVGCES